MLNDKAGAADDLKKALETSPEAAKSPRRTVQQHRTRDERTIQKPQPLRFLNVIKIRYSFTFFPFKRKKAVKTLPR